MSGKEEKRDYVLEFLSVSKLCTGYVHPCLCRETHKPPLRYLLPALFFSSFPISTQMCDGLSVSLLMKAEG